VRARTGEKKSDKGGAAPIQIDQRRKTERRDGDLSCGRWGGVGGVVGVVGALLSPKKNTKDTKPTVERYVLEKGSRRERTYTYVNVSKKKKKEKKKIILPTVHKCLGAQRKLGSGTR